MPRELGPRSSPLSICSLSRTACSSSPLANLKRGGEGRGRYVRARWHLAPPSNDITCSFAIFLNLCHGANSKGPVLPDRLRPTCSPRPTPPYSSSIAPFGSSAMRPTRAAASSLGTQVGPHTTLLEERSRWVRANAGDGAVSRSHSFVGSAFDGCRGVNGGALDLAGPAIITDCTLTRSASALSSEEERRDSTGQSALRIAQRPLTRNRCCHCKTRHHCSHRPHARPDGSLSCTLPARAIVDCVTYASEVVRLGARASR